MPKDLAILRLQVLRNLIRYIQLEIVPDSIADLTLLNNIYIEVRRVHAVYKAQKDISKKRED